MVSCGKTKVQNHQLGYLQQGAHQSGLTTFWLDETAIQAWYVGPNTSSRGRPQRYSELAISTILMLKRVFRLTRLITDGRWPKRRCTGLNNCSMGT
ncbi:transposase [Pectobacterium zantedeschiae]|uniref:transposase n=1 Tax=Pectobacterium zantedeschiae TaxID=2034769 RepID=UPI003BF5B3A9